MESFLCVTLSPISCVFPALHPNIQDPFGTLDFFSCSCFFPVKNEPIPVKFLYDSLGQFVPTFLLFLCF